MSHAHADAEAINRLLDESHGARAIVYESVGSTNAICRGLPNATAPHIVVAREQTAGRGRFDRRFDSSRDAGLYMSLCYTPRGASSPASVTALAGVAACLAIERQTSRMPKIKWVNDVYHEGKKLAGILAEGVYGEGGTLTHAIVGIGVNVKSRPFPDELANIATSIEDAYGTCADINRLCADTVNIFFSLSKDVPAAMRLYRQLSCVVGKRITVHTPTGDYNAAAEDIDSEGNLIVCLDNGEIKTVFSGEISIRII